MQILISEHNPVYCAALSDMLTSWGYSVTIADDGHEAWSILQAPDGPRLAILDSAMPGLDGVEVCRRARAATGMNYVYIVLLTARSKTEDLVEAMEAGADEYIAKPLNSQELRARLRSGCRIIRLQERLIHARQELYEQATHDGLTGIWNRTNIVQILEIEMARAQRSGAPLAVVMADIDHFKRINDTFGHLAGDSALQQTARRMKAAVRQYDSVGRYGGDEFLIVVPGCSLLDSLSLAERLRHATGIAASSSNPEAPGFSCSFGVGWADGILPLTVDDLLRDADSALYLAKRDGRNRVQSLGASFVSVDGKKSIERPCASSLLRIETGAPA